MPEQKDIVRLEISRRADHLSRLAESQGEPKHARAAARLRDLIFEPSTWRIESGAPSWHQSKAGHAFAGSIEATLTRVQLLDHIDRLIARGEPFHVTEVVPGAAKYPTS